MSVVSGTDSEGWFRFRKGDLVKIKEGPFENFEGSVDEIFPDKGVVRVIVSIFGRLTPLEMKFWELEKTGRRDR